MLSAADIEIAEHPGSAAGSSMWLSIVSERIWKRPDLGYRVGIAIPARDEADYVAACIGALDIAAARLASSEIVALVLVNNSSDDTAAVARRLTPKHLRLEVEIVDFPSDLAHAGSARRFALDRCADRLPPDGILMTTDADSCVDPDWIAANLRAIEDGVDAVAGVVTFDTIERATIPQLPLRALEWQLAHLHARLGSLVDPQPHDPWPNHLWAWGASMALTVAAYREVGGLPVMPLAEDRALADALERHDLRVRRCHSPVVYTSARRHGRAPGGLADLIGSYADDPDALCDAVLESTSARFRRLHWRARLRQAFRDSGQTTGFGARWDAIETQSPLLQRHRLLPSKLPSEVRRAERLVNWLERRETGRAGMIPPGCGR